MVKREIVDFLDIGLMATFVRFIPHESEDDFVFLEYVPFDTFPAKVMKYPKPIPKTAIHTVDPLLHLKGMADRIVVIYTGDETSIIKRVLQADNIREMEDLKTKNRSLEMKNAALSQEVENARSGVSKAIASTRSLTKNSQSDSSGPTSIFDRMRARNNPFNTDDE